MENSPYTDATLEIFETLWADGFTNLGVVLQSALFRTAQDLPRVVGRGARVRLVKGAYKEAAEVAYQRKADVDAAYVDADAIPVARGDVSRRWPRTTARSSTRRRRLSQAKASPRIDSSSRCCTACGATCRRRSSKEGYGMRVYVPFGRQWFPYFMRRLGERPANVAFVLKSLASEK